MGLWRLPLRLAAEGALPPLCLRQGPTGYLEPDEGPKACLI